MDVNWAIFPSPTPSYTRSHPNLILIPRYDLDLLIEQIMNN
jgi:hypothetical protein